MKPFHDFINGPFFTDGFVHKLMPQSGSQRIGTNKCFGGCFIDCSKTNLSISMFPIESRQPFYHAIGDGSIGLIFHVEKLGGIEPYSRSIWHSLYRRSEERRVGKECRARWSR